MVEIQREMLQTGDTCLTGRQALKEPDVYAVCDGNSVGQQNKSRDAPVHKSRSMAPNK